MDELSQENIVDIQGIISILPVLDESIWPLLQEKKLKEAEQKFGELLTKLSSEEWAIIYWAGLLEGVPIARGNLNQETWLTEVKPSLIRAAFNASSAKNFSLLCQNLEAQQIDDLNRILIKNIPGENFPEKKEWLKTKRPALFVFFTASPAQIIGLGFEKVVDANLARKIKSKYDLLPRDLKTALFSYDAAEAVFRIGKTNHLPEEKMSTLAKITGLILLGFIHNDDISSKILAELHINNEIANILTEQIKKKILFELSEDLKMAYEPLELPLETKTELREEAIPLEILDIEEPAKEKILPVQNLEEKTLPEIKTGEPLVIHEEKLSPLTEKSKTSFKGFSSPFRFFKFKPADQETQAVKAEIETPSMKPGAVFNEQKSKTAKKRTVHYSEFRTPLNPFESSEEIIGLEKLEEDTLRAGRVTDNKSEVKTPPVAPTEQKPQPKLDGNIIDLRKT